MTSWLVLYETLNYYGPTMLVQSFGISASRAATVMSCFWVLNLATLVVVGRMSDRLQLRKPVSVLGAVCSTLVMAYFVSRIGATQNTVEIAVIGAVLGMFMGVAYVPWMANFSENLEEIRGTLQATGWGIWGFSVRLMIVLIVVVSPQIVAATQGWTSWLIIAAVFEAAYIPVVFAFKGPWRRTFQPAAQVSTQ